MSQKNAETADQPSGAGMLGRQIAASLESITLHKVREIGFRNAAANGAAIGRGKSILALRNTSLCEGNAALVIAAGPSLHRQNPGQLLHEHRSHGKLVVAESSMSWCFRNGIRPDLVVTLDPHPTRIVRWFGDPDLDLAKLQADDYFARQDLDPHFQSKTLARNRELVDLIDRHAHGVPIAMASCASEAVVRRAEQAGMDVYWWNPMYDDYDLPDSLTCKMYAMNGLPCINAGGNVGAACWVIAQAVLEKKQVGLVGMDFGYYAETPYSQTQYYPELVAMVGEDRLDEVFVWIDNPHLGRQHYTDPAYLWYRDAFLEMAAQAECETWNCTDGGILFGPGIRWASLREFLESASRSNLAA